MWVCTCLYTSMGGRGQLHGADSLLPPCAGPLGSPVSALNHLPGPRTFSSQNTSDSFQKIIVSDWQINFILRLRNK